MTKMAEPTLWGCDGTKAWEDAENGHRPCCAGSIARDSKLGFRVCISAFLPTRTSDRQKHVRGTLPRGYYMDYGDDVTGSTLSNRIGLNVKYCTTKMEDISNLQWMKTRGNIELDPVMWPNVPSHNTIKWTGDMFHRYGTSPKCILWKWYSLLHFCKWGFILFFQCCLGPTSIFHT